jgi:tetratricopeptide (TPR) repeat protein
VRVSLGPAAVAISVLLLSGCAARRPAAPSVQPRSVSKGITVESADPRLAAAVLAANANPTAENELWAAEEYHRLGILDYAHTYLSRAIARNPRFAAAHEEMARVWRDWGLADAALESAHRAVRLAPQSAAARNTLGTVLDALGRLDQAAAAYSAAIALDPSAAWALNNLCYVQFRLGVLEPAKQTCESAIRVSPDLAAAHNNLGLMHAARGDISQAGEAFRAAGDEAAAQYNLGIVHLARGQFAEAAAAFEEAIRTRPSFTAAKSRAHEARIRSLNNKPRPGTFDDHND